MKLWFYFDKAFPDILPLLNVVLEPAEDVGKKEKPQDGEHDEQLDFFTALIKKNNDYNQFTLEQKDRLNFGVTLGFVLRELARTDIIIKNGNVPIINTSALRAVYARAKDLMPAEEMPYQI